MGKNYLIDDVKLFAEVTSFKKLDGVLGESDGIKNYTMDYEAELKILTEEEQNKAIKDFETELEKASVNEKAWSIWHTFNAKLQRKTAEKELSKDRLVKIKGKIFFSRTENGWHFVAATENF